VQPYQYKDEPSRLYASRMLSKPLLVMDEIVKSKGKPQFFLFSGHDTNVANLWSYLKPVNLMQKNELN